MLSVIVPVYNVQHFINKCVLSIVNQTYRDLEIILVDDGSTDLSGQLCDEWAKKDERIYVIHKTNGGLSSARNAGINFSHGNFIAFVDSDDFVDINMYQTMISAIERTGKDIACCGRIVDLWGKKEKSEFCLNHERIFNKKEAIKTILKLNIIDVSACDKVYKREIFDTIRYPEGKISEDAAIIFHLLNISNGVVHIGKAFYHYIYRENSISKSSYTHKAYDAYVNCFNTINFIQNNYTDLLKECKIYCSLVCLELLQSMQIDKKIVIKYKDDYKKYKTMFNQGFIDLMRSTDISLKIKIKAVFIFCGKFKLFCVIKNLMTKQ
jgi:glycosyltransferase involved in cell wall biosynthesis